MGRWKMDWSHGKRVANDRFGIPNSPTSALCGACGNRHTGFLSCAAGRAIREGAEKCSSPRCIFLHDWPVSRVEFLRKGRVLYTSTHDGEARPLLTVAGHLSWAWVQCQDQPTGTDEAWADVRRLCSQPGCAEPAVSTYELLGLFNRGGDRSEPVVVRYRPQRREVRLVRRFCPLHLRRGDCALEDADENYRVVDGPGPDEAVGWADYESRSVFGGTVEL